MGRFITSRARIEQTDIAGYWKTVDNELFYDDNADLLLTPRYFLTDGYTFPGFVMALLGDKNKYDARSAHGHDLFCRFHERIVVNKSLAQLKLEGYIHEHEGKVVCEDIPIEYLKVEKISKKYADDTFKNMMIACGMPKDTINIIRFGVNFNINWYLKTGKKSILEYNIYEEDIGLVNGV